MTAYVLSRKRLKGRYFIMMGFLMSWIFEAGLIPNYIVNKSLGLVDSRWIMILPGAISTFLLIVTRSFLDTLPDDMEESAFIDGANDFQIMWKIYLPLCTPIIATIGIFYAISIWNSYLMPMIYLQDPALHPINPVLFQSPNGRLYLLYTAQEARQISRAEYEKQNRKSDYTKQETSIIRYRFSEDQGETWGPVQVFSSKPGSFCRSRSADRIYVSRSSDFGRTWTEPERTVLPNNNASIRAIKLRSGRIAMVFNPVSANDDPNLTVWPKKRYPVTIALSKDEGKTWPYMRKIETGDNFCGEKNQHLNRRYEYPWIHQILFFRTRIGRQSNM
jgi:hypothetical protein